MSETIVVMPKGMGRTMLITYEGRTMSQRDWAKELGMSQGALSLRLKKNNYDLEKACETELACRKRRFLTYDGKTMTMNQWAKYLECSPATIRHRIDDLGLSVEDALGTPINKKMSNHTSRPKMRKSGLDLQDLVEA